jgi:hypothetical protein
LLKFDPSIQNQYYLWAVENLKARTAYSEEIIEDLKNQGTTFYNTRKREICNSTDGQTLICSSTYTALPIQEFYFKRLSWMDEHLVIETNASRHKRNDRDRVEVAPFHNPTLNERASNHRDNVATCNYPNCFDPPHENTNYCEEHQELMDGYTAEVSPLKLPLQYSLTKLLKGRGRFSFFL